MAHTQKIEQWRKQRAMMTTKPPSSGRDDGEHGEGNRAADRDYREDVQDYINAGKVAPASEEARRAIEDDGERKELEEAERAGRSRAADAPAKPGRSGKPAARGKPS